MNRKNLMRKIGGFVLAASLLSGTAIMSSTAVLARGGGGGGGHAGGGFHGGGGFRGGGFRGGGFGLGLGYGYGYPYGYGYGYDSYSHYVFGDSTAADSQGYQDGLKTGANDARRRQSDNPERSHYFKDSGFGNFAQDYREGFMRGYSEGFQR